MDHQDFTSLHSFEGNPLDRSAGFKKDQLFLQEVLANEATKVVLVGGATAKRVMCIKNETGYHLSLVPVPVACKIAGCSSIEDAFRSGKVTLLGRKSQQPDQSWVVVFDVTGVDLSSSSNLSAVCMNQGDVPSLEDGRKALLVLPKADLAIAGQAMALCSWHASAQFDGRNGRPTQPIECGVKRQAADAGSLKIYPRVDPVAIAVIVSPDRDSILLARMKAMPGLFYSCVSGFVDICESVAEAIRREAWEETGIIVGAVDVVDSQPWPIGRGGSCELMIGCIAYAKSLDIEIHDEAVADARWVTLEEAERLLEEAKNSADQSLEARARLGRPCVPGTYAIAHHLMRRYLNIRSREKREQITKTTVSQSCSNYVYMWGVLPSVVGTFSLLAASIIIFSRSGHRC
jgi:NADH pyrophosphatase NudC (nudix superfamily)